MKPRARMKPSGLPWAPKVPAHWIVKKLGLLASLQSGDSITGDDITETGQYAVFGGNGRRGYTDRYPHEGEYALIGRQGALCGNVNYAKGKFWASEHAVVVSPREPVVVRWLGEVLRAMNLNQHSASAAQPGLAVETVSGLRVPVPPLHEQRAIADYLDRETARLDALVAAKERVLGLLAEKRRALITRAVTRGLDTHAPLRDSGIPWLGEIPAHWETKKLGFLTFLKSGESITADDIREEGLYAVYGGNGLRGYTDRFTHDGEYVLIGRQGALCGNINYAKGRFWASEHAVVVSPREEVAIHWLGEQLRTMNLNQYSASAAQPGLAVETIAAIRLPIPPLEEQRNIVQHIARETAKLDSVRAATERTIALLKERRATLIAAAVTGQIDVEGTA